MKTRAIGYVRVSTDKQADRGVSLDAQVEKIKAMATVHDVELLDVLVDAGESAKDLDRPGMVRILEMVQSRAVGMVIVAKLDRLTRSVKDLAVLLEQFQRRGVSLVSVAESLDTGSASGRLVLNIMVSVSQWEREAIGERTRDAMRHKKAKLEFVGNAPYGFRQAADKRYVEPEPGEQAILERIQRLRKSGKSLRKIADQLNRLKIRTRQGSPWRHEYVARLLKALLYTEGLAVTAWRWVLHCHSCFCFIGRRTKAGPTFGEMLGVMLEHMKGAYRLKGGDIEIACMGDAGALVFRGKLRKGSLRIKCCNGIECYRFYRFVYGREGEHKRDPLLPPLASSGSSAP